MKQKILETLFKHHNEGDRGFIPLNEVVPYEDFSSAELLIQKFEKKELVKILYRNTNVISIQLTDKGVVHCQSINIAHFTASAAKGEFNPLQEKTSNLLSNTKRNFLQYVPIGILIVGILTLLLKFGFFKLPPNYNIFSKDDPNLKVVIVPFNNINSHASNSDINAGATLFHELQKKIDSEGFSISPYYLKSFKPSLNFNIDSAATIASKNGWDIFIYGLYDKDTDGNSYVKYGYYLKDDWDINKKFSVLQSSANLINNTSPFSSEMLETGEVAFIIDWIVGVSQLRSYNFQESSKRFRKLTTPDAFDVSDTTRLDIYGMYINILIKLGESDEAFEFVNRALAEQSVIGIESNKEYYSSFLQQKSLIFSSINSGDSALVYVQKALEIYEKNNLTDKDLKISILNSLQLSLASFTQRDSIQKAIDYGHELLAFLDTQRKKTSEDIVLYGMTLGNIGAEYNDLMELDSAIHYLTQGLFQLENIYPTDSTMIARLFSNIGVSYGHLGKWRQVIDFTLKAYRLEKQLGIKGQGHGITCRNIGNAYLRSIPKDTTKLILEQRADSALIFLNEALNIQMSIEPPPIHTSITFSEIAVIHYRKNDFSAVEESILKGLAILQTHYSDQYIRICYQLFTTSLMFLKINDIEKFNKYFQKGDQMFPTLRAEDDPLLYQSTKDVRDALKGFIASTN